MKDREDFVDVLARTLARGWSLQLGRSVRVTPGSQRGEQHWFEQGIFSAYCADRVGPEVRRFLRDSIRFTPVRARLPGQFVAGTLLATRSGLRVTRRVGFSVSPMIEHSERLLVLPGNQRVRIFDFARNRTRVLLKAGFSPRTLVNEVALRSSGRSTAIPPIVACDLDDGWFEEDIIDGWALPRLPIWRSRVRAERAAFEHLETWLAQTTTVVGVGEHTRALVESIRRSITELGEGGLGCALPSYWEEVLVRAAEPLGRVTTSESHGDFQPGNVLVERGSDRVWIIDWEHGARRYANYDWMVWGLRSRGGAGLRDRFRAFVRGAAEAPFDRMPRDAGWRRAALAVFVLEELAWFSAEATSGPYRRVPRGLAGYVGELPELLEVVR